MRPSIHPADLPLEKLLRECQLQRTKRQGPGGQHRNKVESAVVITHRPTGLVGQASERRSQHQNHAVAVQRLRIQLAVHHRVGRDLQLGPSDCWTHRVRSRQIRVNAEHEEFPALLAEALDILFQFDWDPQGAGRWLGVSPTQLVKLLKSHPPALQQLNCGRTARGLPPVR